MAPLLMIKDTIHPEVPFVSNFQATPFEEKVLRTGRMIDGHETPQMMMERMVNTLFEPELRYATPPQEITELKRKFGSYLDSKSCVMSTPVMTNAGRYKDKPLSACTVPPVDLRHDLLRARQIINDFHQDGMGTGFGLDDVDDPVSVLKYLNQVAVDGANSGMEDRPVGNMATLSVYHPKVREFIAAKNGADERGEEWKFNISVDVDEAFMLAVRGGGEIELRDGTKINAKELFDQAVKNAHECADPGLIFMDRMNADNPTPGVGSYVSTAPCAEVGLTPGESCQFGYINLGKFVSEGPDGNKAIDYDKLYDLSRLMTRVLDNALDLSIDLYAHPENSAVMAAKRKIGVGICGLADMLVQMKMPYDSEEARETAQNVVAFINFCTKLESHELAKVRGSCTSMDMALGNRYNHRNGFIEQKYGSLNTERVSSDMWLGLGEQIRSTHLLRNASTIALPPTGRSGLVISASTGVEPIFSLVNPDGSLNEQLASDLSALGISDTEMVQSIMNEGKIGLLDALPEELRRVYATALEISPDGHIEMVAAIQKTIDESVSKTINVPADATPEDIGKIYLRAHEAGLKGITIFRPGSRTFQPRKLAKQ